MRIISSKPVAVGLLALLAVPATTGAFAQELEAAASADDINVYGDVPSDLSGMLAGPDIEGMISARNGNAIQVVSIDGTLTTLRISAATDIRARGGFLGLGRSDRGANALLNGLPVSVETVQWGESLIASKIRFSNDDQEIAAMIHGGTNQRFASAEAGIEDNRVATEENAAANAANAAATAALRGRVADIDQYVIRGSTNVYFNTGRHDVSASDRMELCRIAEEAENTDNALLLVVGYTDDVGDYDYNQELSERRAGRVVNVLQQDCGWAPWRMLSPTGMAESDPTADNSTAAGRAQNRRVSVNILVSKAVDGI